MLCLLIMNEKIKLVASYLQVWIYDEVKLPIT